MDEYHLDRQRKYLEKGWKRYNERVHLYHEFKVFLLDNFMVREWWSFYTKFVQQEKESYQQRKIEKRRQLEDKAFVVLWGKVGSSLFEERHKASIRNKIKAMPDKKLRKLTKEKKPKEQNTDEGNPSIEVALLMQRPPTEKMLLRTANEVFASHENMIPALKDYSEAILITRYWTLSGKRSKLTRKKIQQLWDRSKCKPDRTVFVEALLKIIDTHWLYSQESDLLAEFKKDYPDLFTKHITPRSYYLSTGEKLS